MKNIRTINQSKVGQVYRGVLFAAKTLSLFGYRISGVFPVFSGIKVTLDQNVDTAYRMLGNNDKKFYYGTMRLATEKLRDLIHAGKINIENFTLKQLEDIESGRAHIDGKIWHHCEELYHGRPVMQLVDAYEHRACKHTGGSYTWNSRHY